MSERWRCFVAVPLGDDLRAVLADAVAGWQSRPDLADLRWIDPGSWHVTLAFIGAVDAAVVVELNGRLVEVISERAPMSLETGGVGAFPTARRASVAWYGVHDADGDLRRLAAVVRGAVGVEDGAFRPHVTLARARQGRVDLRPWIAEASAPVGMIAVDRVDLMRSHLGRGPAQHEVLTSVRLGVPSRV